MRLNKSSTKSGNHDLKEKTNAIFERSRISFEGDPMKQFNFDNTYTLGDVVLETALYRHIHYPEMLVRYDSNFVEFLSVPSLDEFKEVEKYLLDFHQKRGQNHLKFYFPENMKLEGELNDYLTTAGYGRELLELYAIQPHEFPEIRPNSDIQVEKVTTETLETLMELKYIQDLEFGEAFAEQKRALTRRKFADPQLIQVLAVYQGVAVGYVDLILSKDTVEIDDLSVEEAYQKKGIGSHLQQFSMKLYPGKTIILLADGEDTPRNMYRKQNYQYLGFRQGVLKELI